MDRWQRQLQEVADGFSQGAGARVELAEVGDEAELRLPEAPAVALAELLEPLGLVRGREGGALRVARDDVWRVLRHLELALPEAAPLRDRVAEGRMEPLPGLARFGPAQHSLPAAKWVEMTDEERARFRERQEASQTRARQWGQELAALDAVAVERLRGSWTEPLDGGGEEA